MFSGREKMPTSSTLFFVEVESASGLPGENQGNVVGLLFGTDPGVEGKHYLVRDDVQRLVAVAADHLHHAFFAELAEVVLRFGHAVGVGDEDIAGLHLEAVFVVAHAIHEPNDGSSLVQSANVAVTAK